MSNDSDIKSELDMITQALDGLQRRITSLENGGGGLRNAPMKIEDVMVDPGGEGGGVGPFAVVDGKITNRVYMVSRFMYTISGSDPDAEDGRWSLVVPNASPGSATLVKDTSETTGNTYTVIDLFVISDGEITTDYRGMPLVMLRE